MGNRSKSHHGLETIVWRDEGVCLKRVVIFLIFMFRSRGMGCLFAFGNRVEEWMDAGAVNSKGQVQYFVPLPRS